MAGLGCLFGFVVDCSVAGATNEFGRPVVRDFPPGRSGIGHLCQAVTQDAAGFIYLANGAIARIYDGASWRPIVLPTESAGIRKFAVTADGTVYAGGASVMGYFRGVGEGAEFISLADRLPPSDLGCTEIHEVLAVGNTIYFADEEKILIWRDGHFTVIPCRSPPYSRGARLHRIGEAVYVTALDRPLRRLGKAQLEEIVDDPVFRQNEIVVLEAGPAGTLRALTAERGFFALAGGKVSPLATDANRWLEGKAIWRAQRLGDGSLAVAFTSVSGDGGMRFSAEGVYLGPIDNSIGLYVKTLRGFFPDREGGLWVGSETGVFRLEWPSALTVFDGINGLGAGAVADVVRHEGVLYAATSEGVFRLAASDDRDGRVARFERISTQPAYALVSHPGGLLVLGYAQVLVQAASGFIPVATLPAGGGTMHRSSRQGERVWVESTRGVYSLSFADARWRDEGSVANSGQGPVEPLLAADGVQRRVPQLVREAVGAIGRTREEIGRDTTVLWICGAKGLARVDVARGFPGPVPFTVLLFATGVRAGDRLPPGPVALKFDYVALRHQIAHSVGYQTRLVGLDRDWLPWSPVRQRVLNHLPAGDYRFEVRARDADGRLSPPASLAFTVLPFWWLTRWALVSYVAAGLGLIGGVVRFRTKALNRRADRLEAIVAARTCELAQQTVELTRLNRLESAQKIAARFAEEKARLEALRYQLNPHFLYNTLASISASLPADQSIARTMVERLADFCRLTLDRPGGGDWTTLGEEMAMLRIYLAIEHSRWGDLLDLEIVCDPALAGERLPYFLLLPLVENALKHGRATSPERVGLRLAARREASGDLLLEVANTGEWIEPAVDRTTASLGIGLDNLRERLSRYYPGTHSFCVSPAGGWVTVTLRLPASGPTLASPPPTTPVV